MQLITVAIKRKSKAPPSDVFVLLKDGSSWPSWSLFSGFKLERKGDGDPLGVGAIRVLASPGRKSREEVVAILPDQQLSYILLSGMPFREYRADVMLAPTLDGGTEISWTSRFYPVRRGSGWFWKLFIRCLLADTARRLAKGAQNPAIVTTSRTLLSYYR